MQRKIRRNIMKSKVGSNKIKLAWGRMQDKVIHDKLVKLQKLGYYTRYIKRLLSRKANVNLIFSMKT